MSQNLNAFWVNICRALIAGGCLMLGNAAFFAFGLFGSQYVAAAPYAALVGALMVLLPCLALRSNGKAKDTKA